MKGVCVYVYKEKEWDDAHWDARYVKIDLQQERISRLNNIEYLDFINAALSDHGLAETPDRSRLKAIELGCGCGPLGRYLENQGYTVRYSDYSSILVRRLKEEFDCDAVTLDCTDLSPVAGEGYDIVLLAGTVMESDDYDMASRVYGEIFRVLKPNGLFIHFLNRHADVMGRIRYSPLVNFISNMNPLNIIRRNNFIRAKLDKPPVYRHVHNWLYEVGEIREMLAANGFKIAKVADMQIEAGLLKRLPLLRPLLLKTQSLNRFGQQALSDIAYKHRRDILTPLGLGLSELIRR